MPQAAVVTEEQLGVALNPDDLQLLRQSHAALGAGSNSSRNASRASSSGVLMLDGSSLAALARYFDRIMDNIQSNMQKLGEQSQQFTQVQFDHAGNLIAGADAEIARFHQILAQLDNLEMEFDRISNIKMIVKQYRNRVEEVDRSLEASASSSKHKHSSSRHGHSSHKHSSSKHHSSSHRSKH